MRVVGQSPSTWFVPHTGWWVRDPPEVRRSTLRWIITSRDVDDEISYRRVTTLLGQGDNARMTARLRKG